MPSCLLKLKKAPTISSAVAKGPPILVKRASALLGASLFLISVAAVFPREWLPGAAIMWYGALMLGFLSVINAAHIAASWQVFYRNPVIREREGARFKLEFILLPPIYMTLFTVAAAWAYSHFPGTKALLFLLVFDGPLFAHHVASQDKGFLAVFSFSSGSREKQPWVRDFFFPLMLVVMAVAFSRSIVLEPGIAASLGAGVSFFSWLFLGAASGGAAACAWAAWHFWRRHGLNAEVLYFLSIGAWCAANLLLVNGLGLPLALLMIHSLRHALLYTLLVERYFAGRAKSEARGMSAFWIPLAVATVPASVLLFFVYLGLPGFWPGLYAAWAPAGLEAAYPWLMGGVGALLLHHYHIERHSWCFREKKLGEHLRAHLLSPPS